jgi:hypothetical protein
MCTVRLRVHEHVRAPVMTRVRVRVRVHVREHALIPEICWVETERYMLAVIGLETSANLESSLLTTIGRKPFKETI